MTDVLSHMDDEVLQIGSTSVRKVILRNAMLILIIGSIGFTALNSWLRLAMEEYYSTAYRAEMARVPAQH